MDNIKKFLKIIFKGNIFKSIYKLLYTEEDLKIIMKDEFIDDYIDNHLFLIPYKSENYCGITDRFSCNSYIFFGNNIVNVLGQYLLINLYCKSFISLTYSFNISILVLTPDI